MNQPSAEQMKQELIEEHRTMNVDYDDWAEHVYEWFEEYLATRGIEWSKEGGTTQSRDMTWSGFWSQGDGFGFGGEIVNKRFKKYVTEHKYPMLYKLIDDGGFVKMYWHGDNRNYRNAINVEAESFGQIHGEDHPLKDIWDVELDKEMERLESDLDEDLESMCKMMYRKLEEEYDNLTSDEAVWETIVANDLNSITNDEGETAWVSA